MIHSYTFRISKAGPEMTELSNLLLPVLFDIYHTVRTNFISDINTPFIMVEIEKIFGDFINSFKQIFLPNLNLFQTWMNEYKICLDIQLGEPGENIIPCQPEDIDEREKFKWWKVKKWIFNIINKIFNSYGKPKYI